MNYVNIQTMLVPSIGSFLYEQPLTHFLTTVQNLFQKHGFGAQHSTKRLKIHVGEHKKALKTTFTQSKLQNSSRISRGGVYCFWVDRYKIHDIPTGCECESVTGLSRASLAVTWRWGVTLISSRSLPGVRQPQSPHLVSCQPQPRAFSLHSIQPTLTAAESFSIPTTDFSGARSNGFWKPPKSAHLLWSLVSGSTGGEFGTGLGWKAQRTCPQQLLLLIPWGLG